MHAMTAHKHERSLLTVVVVARNAASTLGGLLAALRDQHQPLERLLVDDGSQDESAELARSAGWRVIGFKRPAGTAAARQLAVENCNTPYLAFTDADCVPANDWIDRLLCHCASQAAPQVIVGNTITPCSTLLANTIAALGFPGGGSIGFDAVWPVAPDGRTVTFCTCNCMMHTELFSRYGGFKSDVPPQVQAEDTLLAQRWIDAGVSVRYDPALVVQHAPRKALKSFLSWQWRRGRGVRFIHGTMGDLTRFLSWRRYYLKKLLARELRKLRGPGVLALLLAGEIARLGGYIEFAFSERTHLSRARRRVEREANDHEAAHTH